MDRVQEAVTETALVVFVPDPGVLEVDVDEFVKLDTKAHASRVARGAALGAPLLDLTPAERARLAGVEHRGASLGFCRPQLVDLVLVDVLAVQTRGQLRGDPCTVPGGECEHFGAQVVGGLCHVVIVPALREGVRREGSGQSCPVELLLQSGASPARVAQLGDERVDGFGLVGTGGEFAHPGQASGCTLVVLGAGVDEFVFDGAGAPLWSRTATGSTRDAVP